MGKIIAEITMSIDGFIAGPGVSDKQPMGAGGDELHDWMFAKSTPADKHWVNELVQSTGAVITGNHTYSVAIDGGWSGTSPFKAPAFVVCHAAPSKEVKGFVYVTGGIHEALRLAKETAREKNVWIMGGANIIQQYLKQALVDELRLHIAPVLLMQGTKLFDNIGVDPAELEKESVTDTAGALHIVLKVKK